MSEVVFIPQGYPMKIGDKRRGSVINAECVVGWEIRGGEITALLADGRRIHESLIANRMCGVAES